MNSDIANYCRGKIRRRPRRPLPPPVLNLPQIFPPLPPALPLPPPILPFPAFPRIRLRSHDWSIPPRARLMPITRQQRIFAKKGQKLKKFDFFLISLQQLRRTGCLTLTREL
jgi:hypothetical protein